jgi:hypothetical protein
MLLIAVFLLLTACGSEEGKPELTGFESFLVDVFEPSEAEKVLVMVDLPHDAITDNPLWQERREMAEEWRSGFVSLGQKLGFDVHPLYSYPATGGHSSPLPATGQLDGETVLLDDILADTTIAVAMTEYSATAPLATYTGRLPELRVASMPMVNKGMEQTALAANYGQMAVFCNELYERLDRAESAQLTFSTGHELSVDLRYRQAEIDDGHLPPDKESSRVINLPSGEAYIAPYEGERPGEPSNTHGDVPIPRPGGRFALARLDGNMVTAFVDENRAQLSVTEVLGPEKASRNLAELGLGCNDRAVITGNVLEDEKVMGVHLALGLSEHIGGVTGVDDYSDPASARHEDRVFPFGGKIEVVRLVLEYADGTAEAIIQDGAYSLSSDS